MLFRPAYHLCRHAPPLVPPTVLHGRIGNPRHAYALARRLCSLMSSGSGHDRRLARGVLTELLVVLLDAPAQDSPRAPETRSLASRIRARLDNRILTSRAGLTNLPELLKDFANSYEHLCRLFRHAYGVPPLKYVRARQISRAQVLLSQTDMTVSEIAYQTGFDSPAYFTKVFRVLTGRTPGAYRCGVVHGSPVESRPRTP